MNAPSDRGAAGEPAVLAHRDRPCEAAEAAPTAVLTHGLGGSAADWAPQVDALVPERRVVVPDLRGHGRSVRVRRRVRVPEHAADVLTLLDTLGEREPVHLVGVSLGSMVALELAASAPSRVRSVTAMSAIGDARIASLRALRFFLARWIPLRLFGPRKIATLLAPRLFPGERLARVRADFVEAWSKNDPRSYRACFEGTVGWTIHDRAAAIACPLLVLRGARDYFPADLARRLADEVPRGRLVELADAGHGLPAERPAETNAVLVPFLRACDGSG